jgi:nucleoside 2-deoxyribosyltransferase
LAYTKDGGRKITVYLAGPMPTEGNWREKIKESLPADIYRFYDPVILEVEPLTDHSIVNLDKVLITRSDLVIVNVTRLSHGTAMEIAFCQENNIPCLVIFPEGKNSGPWGRYHSSGDFKSIKDCLKFVREIFEKKICDFE